MAAAVGELTPGEMALLREQDSKIKAAIDAFTKGRDKICLALNEKDRIIIPDRCKI